MTGIDKTIEKLQDEQVELEEVIKQNSKNIDGKEKEIQAIKKRNKKSKYELKNVKAALESLSKPNTKAASALEELGLTATKQSSLFKEHPEIMDSLANSVLEYKDELTALVNSGANLE